MSLTPAQEMLNVKLNCDGFMTDSESEEEEGVSKLSKKSEALLDVKNKPGVVLAVEEQNEVDMEGATGENGKSIYLHKSQITQKQRQGLHLALPLLPIVARTSGS